MNLLIGQETLNFRACRAASSRKGPRRSIRSSDFNFKSTRISKKKDYSILKTRDFPLASSDPGWTAGDFIFLTIDDPDVST
jgi:hypothetical protein